MLSLTCGQTLLVASFDATSSFFRWGSLVSIKCPPLSLTSAEPKHKNSLNLENTPHVRPDMLLLRTHARTHPVSSPSAHTPVEANAAEEPTGAWSRVQAVGAPAPGDRRRWRGGLNGVSAPTTGRGGPHSQMARAPDARRLASTCALLSDLGTVCSGARSSL